MKKKVFGLLVLVVLFAFFGCDNQTANKNLNNAIVDNSEGFVYILEASTEQDLLAFVDNAAVDVIKITCPISLSNNLVIGEDRVLTIDLNKNSITFSDNKSIVVKDNASLTITNPKDAEGSISGGAQPLNVCDEATLIIEGGQIGDMNATWAICAFNNSTLIVNGGTIISGDTGIASNNLTQPNDGSKSGVTMEINGGLINAPVGIFYPSLGSLTIGDEAKIEGIDGVVIKGGSIKISEKATIETTLQLNDVENIKEVINWGNGWDAKIGRDVIIVSNAAYADGENSPFKSIDIVGDRSIFVAMTSDDPICKKYVNEDNSNLYIK